MWTAVIQNNVSLFPFLLAVSDLRSLAGTVVQKILHVGFSADL